MKINRAEFYTSAIKPQDFPVEDFPSIAFVGRSNVGKSSVINCLLQRRNLAKTSNTPGKTRAVNFYLVNGSFYLVDLPGYGFARVSLDIKTRWKSLVEGFLENNNFIVLAIQLIDIRHPPTDDDCLMYRWLSYYGFRKVIIANKADKVSYGRWPKHIKQVKETLSLPPGEIVIPFSAKTGAGRKELWDEIKKSVKLG